MKKKIIFVLTLVFASMALQATNSEPVVAVSDSLSLIQKVEKWYGENMNYTTITVLMTVESSFIPFPSEIVIPPAAYIASKPESDLNIFLVVLFGTLGAMIGAYINYFLAIYLGRPLLYKLADSKLGHLFLLNSEKIKKSEAYFNKHGKTSTFVGRLVPGIRQLISIPAGLAKMNLVSFSIYTFLGAGLWNVILALLGYIAHGQKDLIDMYNKELSVAVLVIVGLVVVYFVVKSLLKKYKK